MNYPIFRRGTGSLPAPRFKVERPKKRDVELDSKWSRFAASYLRKNPLCAECARQGRVATAAAVDHIVPRRHGGSLWDKANLQPLCAEHHNSLKRDLERLAIDAGDVQLLVNWMKKPETRPGRYAFVAAEDDDDDRD